MELVIIGAAVAVVSGVSWLVMAAQQRERKRRRAELTRQRFTSGLTHNRRTVYDQMDRTSNTYLNNVQDTLRRER